ncbi:uncharacterized protein MKK02DRAFT_44706 [Dioszegia hungarica]|uniref:Uncharacterized protein n=1 Tax=Dioszegia hungarica TaxID=4972 RepID=A0AA38H835_9TREE|nr:uncharacterized protein MKK02DRAFT_44706 [Dioszegia hungarica]KAI9636008.1 hypothetical protein MKK02DRAFT_44706 [Dioszegia hungarica]
MPMNINPHMIHHPFVNPDEIPFPTMVLPGGGRLAIYPAVKTRYPGPGVGIGAGVTGMPHQLGGPLGWGAGTGIDCTAAAWRRYYGVGGMMTGYPLGYRLPGPTGMGGYFGGWGVRD